MPKNEARAKHKGVFERPVGSGKWWIRIPRGDGTYRKESIGTQQEAIRAYSSRMTDAAAGPTLKAAMARYLVLRPTANHAYASHARYFNARYPGVTLAQFCKIDHLRLWQTERLLERSKATVNHEMAFLSVVLQQAIEDGLLEENPIGGRGRGRLRYLRITRGRTRWLHEDEEPQLREALGEERWDAVTFAVNTGLRRGEQHKLEWRDWQGDTLWVAAAKTERGRTVFLNEAAMAVLRKRKDQGLERPFPFKSAQGLARTFNRTAKKLGMDDLTWHGLRHTTGTRLIRNGANARAVQRVLGHSSMSMTERYTHVEDDQLRDTMGLLNQRKEPPC